MAELGEQRRLAAIFAADMVGYSRLMEADERGTIARQKVHRTELMDPKIAEHHGRIVKTTGDGMLVEFASVVDAVECAVAIQRAMVELERDVSEERRIQYRVGINLGDIVIEGDDIFGDGVNIAARLEEMAEPGGIWISGTSYDQLKRKVEAGYEFLGEQQVKNIAEPVRAYRVLIEPEDAGKVIGERRPRVRHWQLSAIAASVVVAVAVTAVWLRPWATDVEPASVERMALPLPDRPSIAVLPFDNLSGDPEQEYFSDGITEDIITDLSNVSGLFVIARNSSFKFKGKLVDVRDVARDLGVRYVLEGSVRKVGNQVRINAQLVDTSTSVHMWAERFDRDYEDIFALQDEVIGRIVSALAIKLTDAEKAQQSTRRGTVDLEAYDNVLRGRKLLSRITGQDTARAREYFEKAVSIDPDYARAYTNLGLLFWNEWQLWGRDRDANLARAFEFGKKAIELDPADAGPRTLLALVHQFRKEHALGEMQASKAIALKPTHAETLGNLGGYLTFAGHPREASEFLERAVRLDPYHPNRYLSWLGLSYFFRHQHARAIQVLKRAIGREPDYVPSHLILSAANAELGNSAEARTEAAEVLRINPRFTLRALVAYIPLRKKADLDRYVKALRKAGIPE